MTDTEASTTGVVSPRSADTAFLSCLLGGRPCALPILQVREIIGMIAVTTLPRAPAHVLGVGYHRGRLLPVIDLSQKLGIAAAGGADETCIVVVEAGLGGRAFCVGCVVDEVREVVTLPAAAPESRAQPLGGPGDGAAAGGGQALNDLLVLDIEQLLADLDPATSDHGE